jgi:hypothetical protein
VNQVLRLKHLLQPRWMPLVWLLLLFLLLLLTACLGGGDDAAQDVAAPETAVQQTGSLTCSNICQIQGQCGTAADGRILILANSSQPATRNHNAVLENDSPVFILEQQSRTVADPAGNISNLDFFAVQPTGGGPASWVAGSCVNITTQQ